ncbi:MAG TPA: penicillin acylase family protein, partial [Woeseiaceae bacterium]
PPNGWIQNCNSTPFTAAGAFSPKRENYPVYMAPDAENFRGVHAVRLLRGIEGLTLDSLIELAYDPQLPGFEKLIPGLVEAWDEHADTWPALTEPIAILRNWDLRVSADSVAMTLAHFYGVNYSESSSGIRDAYDLERIELIDYLGTNSPLEERLQAFADTVAMLEADFGRWDLPWGEVNRYQRINGAIKQPFNDELPSLPVGMASGNWGALASFGARRYLDTKRIYGTSGNSFVAVVEFGDRVKAKSMLAGGQSGDPESPHFDDQAQRYVDREFKDVAYYREDVERRAEKSYHPGEA